MCAEAPNDPSSAAAEGGATAARGGRGGGAAGVTPGAVRCSAIVRRCGCSLFAWLRLGTVCDWLLSVMPLRVLRVRKVSRVRICLVADHGSEWLLPMRCWEVTADECPRLMEKTNLTITFETWEGADTGSSRDHRVHCLPGIADAQDRNMSAAQS